MVISARLNILAFHINLSNSKYCEFWVSLTCRLEEDNKGDSPLRLSCLTKEKNASIVGTNSISTLNIPIRPCRNTTKLPFF